MTQLSKSKNNFKGFISLFNNIFSKFLFVIFYIQILKYNGKCTNNEPYKDLDLDICASECNIEQLFTYKTCIPVSVSSNHIEEMTDKILTYIENYNSPEDILNDIIIEGEGITYQISNNNLIKNQNNANNLINIDFGNKCLNNLKDICENFYIILINGINTNFTTSKGILMLSENEEYELSLNTICKGESITYGIPISIPQETKIIYKKIKDMDNYDILNLNSSFYTDICELFETEDNLDMSLSKRIEVFGSHGIDVCSNNCKYIKFDIDKNKVYCECQIISEEEIENEARNIGQQIYDSLADFLDLINFDVMLCVKLVYSGGVIGLFKNYGFIIMTLLTFLYIISMIIAFCIIKKTVKKKLDNFTIQKQKFKNMLDDEEKKLKKENNNKNEAQNINMPILKLNDNKNRINEYEEEEEEEDDDEEEEEEEDEEEEEEEDDDEEMEEEEDEEDIKEKNKDNIFNKNEIENYKNNINNNEDDFRKQKLFDLEMERKKFDDYYKRRDELKLDNKKDSIKIPSIKFEREEPNYLDYYRQQYYYYNYYNYYNNYLQYMNQHYQRNLQNMNMHMQQQQQNQPPSQNNNINLNKLKDNDVIKLVIPYDKIIENIRKAKREKKEIKERKKSRNKAKVNKSIKKNHNKSTKKLTQKKGKNKEKRSDFENPERVIRMPKKRKTKNKMKKKKEQKPMKLDIKLPDNIKVNPPKKIKIRNNEELISSRNTVLKNNMEDSKKDDISVYKLNNNRNISNIKKSPNHRGKKNIKIKENDLTLSTIRNHQNENKKKESEINNNENMIKFGSDEFYKSLLKIPEEKRKEFLENDELNYLEYQYALLFDKRSFCEVYISVLKKQNILILCLSYCSKDYNLWILKFSFLMFQLAIFITVSAFFFTDNALNNIYENKNKFDIPFMVRQLALTFLICQGLNIIFKLLMITDNLILRMKYEKDSSDEGIYSIKCKLILYFILCLIIILFGWYYIGCFCAIYRHTQIILMKCAGYSLCISFVYQIFLSLLSPAFRKCAINSQTKDKKCLYEFSKILSYL